MQEQPPRKLSITDPLGPILGPQLDILLDDAIQDGVTAFDCDEGWIERLQTDQSGQLLLNPAKTAVLDERVHGKVEARWK